MIAIQRRCGPLRIVALGVVLVVPGVGRGTGNSDGLFSSPSRFLGTVMQDYEHMFLSPDRLLGLGIGFGAGAIMANTNTDRDTQEWYQDHIRSDSSDHASEVAKVFGEGPYLIPVCIGTAILADVFSSDAETSLVGTWGQRATRAYLAGGPVVLFAQTATGGSRPTEGDSHWQPFQDDNGVSGHAFIGAVPFLTAGRMCEVNPLARYLFYAASVLPALSRVNDNAHYPSQALLGWFLAWESTGAVFQTDGDGRRVSLTSLITNDACGLAVCIQW